MSKPRLLVGAALSCAAFALPAEAQDAQRDAAVTLEEIKVEGRERGATLGSGGASTQPGPGYSRSSTQAATKTGTPTRETPFAVNVVPQELMQERQPLDLSRALETVPGVSIGYGGGFTASGRPRIRGFGAVSTFKDGFRQSAGGAEIDLANIEQIEVLKGPASALYGRFEPGGVVNFVTKSPTERRIADVWSSIGSDGFFRSGLDLGGKANEAGTALYRFNAAFERSDGFRDHTDYDKVFLAPAVTLKPSDDTTITLKGEYLKWDGPFDRGLPNHPISLSLPISRNLSEKWMRSDKDQFSGSVELLHRFNEDWQVRVAAFGGRVDADMDYVLFGAGWPPAVVDPETGLVNRRFVAAKESYTDTSVQAEALGTFETGALRHKVLFGTEYSDDDWRFKGDRAGDEKPFGIDPYDPIYQGRPPSSAYQRVNDGLYRIKAVGLYAQDEIALGQWRFLAGGRFEHGNGKAEDRYYPEGDGKATFNTFSPRLGLTYLLNDEISLYGSWARSTRLEIDNGLLDDGSIPKPTRGEQFEVGVKGSFLDGTLLPTVSLFDLTKKNAVTYDPTLVNSGGVQTGELSVRGVELELQAQPTERWRFTASYTYQDAEISKDEVRDMVGNQLQNTPKHLASLWTSYDFGAGGKGLTVGGGVFHSSGRPTTNDNTFFLPSYTRFDAFVSYGFTEKTRLTVNVNNLTDKTYYVVGGFGMVHPQPPRQVLATLRHSF